MSVEIKRSRRDILHYVGDKHDNANKKASKSLSGS